MPAISLGVQDFIGTGVFSGEYVVGTKTVGPLKASVGLGGGAVTDRTTVFKNPLSGGFHPSLIPARPAKLAWVVKWKPMVGSVAMPQFLGVFPGR